VAGVAERVGAACLIKNGAYPFKRGILGAQALDFTV
jgi:hypothetical protein